MTIGDPVPGRPTSALTRRDVALSLLTVPSADAIEALPGLRRELLGAGNPLSTLFWSAAETMLAAIDAGRANLRHVGRWLESTGTQPIALLPDHGFVWPDEDERGPVAAEMHARLVSHLEQLVAAETIDPDRLVTGERDEWAAYERIQLTWLHAPLPDGREPIWAVTDEQDEEFVAEWEAADAIWRDALTATLAEIPERPLPEAELATACRHIRDTLGRTRWPYDLLRTAGGVEVSQQPADDEQLWLALAAGVVTYADEVPDGLGRDAWAAWMTLARPEWMGAVVALARGGPGTAADAADLARYVQEYDTATQDADDEAVLTDGFGAVVLLWAALGAVDADHRLTALGWWGVPRALELAWTPSGS